MLLIGRPLLRAPQPQKPLRGCRMDEVYTWGQVRESVCSYIRVSEHTVHLSAHVSRHTWWYFVWLSEFVCWRVRPCSGDHPSCRPGAACRTAQVNFSSGQAPLSGSPMWFHLDRQGLRLQVCRQPLRPQGRSDAGGRPNWMDMQKAQ